MKVIELFEEKIGNFDSVDVAKTLKIKCGDMLDAYRMAGSFIYRGITGYNDRFIEKTIRQDRKPVEMPPQSHELLHKVMIEMGLKATRKNSIFCSTSPQIARTWGLQFIIFVEDGWSATYFEKKLKDYSFYELHSLASIYDDADENAESMENLKSEISRTLKPKTANTPAELNNVIERGIEDILITGNKYYGLRLGSGLADAVLDELKL